MPTSVMIRYWVDGDGSYDVLLPVLLLSSSALLPAVIRFGA